MPPSSADAEKQGNLSSVRPTLLPDSLRPRFSLEYIVSHALIAKSVVALLL